jgi:4-amino-4-deoxy-L-arabinose transferase-like glycosyltransferase
MPLKDRDSPRFAASRGEGVLHSVFLETTDKLLHRTIEERKRIAAAAVAVAISLWICLFSHLGALGLTGPDEPRYAWIARAMARTGDWVTPRLYGNPWFEKPVLYYWAAAIGFRLHLSDEWAARLPSAVAALIAALCIGWLAQRLESADSGDGGGSRRFCPWSPSLLAPLIFATSVAAIGFARAATPDMLFAASVTLAMAAATTILQDAGALRAPARSNSRPRETNAPAALLFGAFIGLAVLAKGPAGIVLAGGAVLIWAIATKRWAATFRLLHPYAIVSFCVVALPWYVLCAVRNPLFLHVFIFQQNFERYVTPMFHHPQPFWFFVPITLMAILPWTAFLTPVGVDALGRYREKKWRDSPAFFFGCWALFPVLFFSFSESKLPSYILPAIPALALVIAIFLAPWIQRTSREGALVFAMFGATWLGLAAGALVWLRHLPKPPALDAGLQTGGQNTVAHAPLLAASTLALIAAAAIFIFSRSRKRAAMWISLALTCLLVEIGGIAVLPDLDAYYSSRPIGTMLRRDLRPDRLFTYGLPRAKQYGLDFYLGRALQEWSPSDRNGALVLTTPKGFAEIEQRGYFRGTLNEPFPGIVFVPIPARSSAGTPQSFSKPSEEVFGLRALSGGAQRQILRKEVGDLVFVIPAVFVGHVTVAHTFFDQLPGVRSLRVEGCGVPGEHRPVVGLDEELGHAPRRTQAQGKRQLLAVLIIQHAETKIAEGGDERQRR